jgi:hypothetical protein
VIPFADARGVKAVKLAFAVLVFIWIICGAAGAWMLDELDSAHWKSIAKGPITLADAFNEKPVTYPGPD